MFGLDEEQITGVAVVTGVATGASVHEACPTIDNGNQGVVTGEAAGAAVDEACSTIENCGEDATQALDDSNWLGEISTSPEPSTAP
jgi:hypothetical protein